MQNLWGQRSDYTDNPNPAAAHPRLGAWVSALLHPDRADCENWVKVHRRARTHTRAQILRTYRSYVVPGPARSWTRVNPLRAGAQAMWVKGERETADTLLKQNRVHWNCVHAWNATGVRGLGLGLVPRIQQIQNHVIWRPRAADALQHQTC